MATMATPPNGLGPISGAPIPIHPGPGRPWGPRTSPASSAGTGRPSGGTTRTCGARAVTGYYIQATDGDIGQVEDYLVDDQSGTIRYLLVDTTN